MAKRPRQQERTGLFPGEEVELSISLFVKERGHEAWLKAGGKVVVQPDEDGDSAAERLSTFIADQLVEQSEDLAEMLDR